MTIAGMKQRFEAVNTDMIVYHAMKECEGDINDLNLEQMYDGKSNKGEDLRPTYLEDPYWQDHSFGGQPEGPRSALAYSDWKQKITPNPRRSRHAVNLFITGVYHKSRFVVVFLDRINYYSSVYFGDDIQDKWKDVNGLGGHYKHLFLYTYLTPVLKEKMFEATGLLMK